MLTDSDHPLWQQWHAAATAPALDAALRDLYARLDADVASRGPTCWVSGRCCKFADFSHRLYVTGLEIAWFTEQVLAQGHGDQREQAAGETTPSLTSRATPLRLPQHAETAGACPYQLTGLCSQHRVRPMGCRIFFCQDGTDHWQHELYEQYLAELRALHEQHSLPYRYMDWLIGLDEAAAALSPA